MPAVLTFLGGRSPYSAARALLLGEGYKSPFPSSERILWPGTHFYQGVATGRYEECGSLKLKTCLQSS